MDKSRVYEIISAFRKAIEAEGIKPDKVILFGSFATGESREDSDIDIIIISRDFSNKSYWERIDILSSAIYRIFEPIEATAFTPEEWEGKKSLLVDYAKNGEVVYG
ncbi:MAG: nucleotidyltransferase domain-containing protein [Sedimentisphaerales bacterium]